MFHLTVEIHFLESLKNWRLELS